MQAMISFLNQGWVGFVVGIFGIALAIYFGFRKDRPNLVFQYWGQRLISGKSPALPDGFAVSYNGQVIDYLTLTNIVFWNHGHVPVKRADVPVKDPLTFYINENSKILKIELSRITRESNLVSANITSEKRNEIKIDFEFLNEGDGALLKVWHTSSTIMPKFKGTIIGSGRGIIDLGRISLASLSKNKPSNIGPTSSYIGGMFLYFMFSKYSRIIWLILCTAGLIGVFLSIFPKIHGYDVTNGDRIGTGVVSTLYFALGAFYLVLYRQRIPRLLLPEELS